MDNFWSNVFEYFNDRRVGGVFFRTLLILIVLLAAVALFHEYLVYVLPVAAGIFLIWIGRGIFRALARRGDRYKSLPLSRDELSKARSKLTRAKN